MTAIINLLLKLYVYLATLLIFLSFSGLTPAASFVLKALSGPAVLLVFINRWMRSGRQCPYLLLPVFSMLLLWLCVQQAGIYYKLAFFDVPSSLARWLEIFGFLFTGFALYLSAEHTFSERKPFTRYIYFCVATASACCVYFIYLFYTSGVEVEYLQPPFLLLNHFGVIGPLGLQPNNLVDLFIPPFFFALSMVLYNQKRKLKHSDPAKGFSEMLLFLCFMSVLLAGIFFTNSRAGILSFIAGIIVYFILVIVHTGVRRRGLKFTLWLIVGSAVFLGSLGTQKILGELGTVHATVTEELTKGGTRSDTIGASWQLVTRRGFLGVGLGNFFMGWLLTHSAPHYFLPARSYNDYLWFWAEAGLPGIVLLMAMFVVFFITSFKTARKTQSSLISYFINAAFSSVAAYCLHAAVDPTFYVEALFWLLCLVLGVGGAACHMEIVEVQGGFVKRMLTVRNPIFQPLAAIVAGVFVSYTAICSLIAITEQGRATTIQSLEKAYEIDPYNPYYGRALALLHYSEYQEKSQPEALARALRYMDESLEKDPFAVLFYKKLAEMHETSGDTKKADRNFTSMHERVPSFYLASLVEASYYMEAALRKGKESEAYPRLKAKAIRTYQKAVKLNPNLSKQPVEERFRYLSEEGRLQFVSILDGSFKG